MKQPVLHAEELTKAFHHPTRVEVLRGVSLTVYPGDTLAIMGASGEGKSTLLHILATLEQPCGGRLEILGQNASRPSPALRNRHIGMVFQSYNLLEDYTVLDNVLMPARIARQATEPGSVAYTRALQLLAEVDLSGRAHFPTKLLSGGEKQRAALARALCNDPDILLADEPSGNLDHQTSQQIHALLLHFARNHNKALIIVTHDQELAALCTSVYRLQDGKLAL